MSTGVGITAASEDDAVALFRRAWPTAYQITAITIIADMREVDQGHVAPNMENWMKRGIWYPRGYQHLTS
jgi:hypothetical protein